MTHTTQRRRLSETRQGLTYHGTACGLDFYITINFFVDGSPGEIFIHIAKEGSDIAGWADAWAITVSMALQYGVPWEVMEDKYLNQRFGLSDHENPSLLHAIAKAVGKLIKETRHGDSSGKSGSDNGGSPEESKTKHD